MANKVGKEAEQTKQIRVSQTDVPGYSLKDALRVSAAIHENFAGDPTTPLNVASAMSLTPSSSNFRQLTGASVAYGLTEGGYNANAIALTETARRIHAPLEEGQDVVAKRQAFLKPRVINEFISKYDGHAIPKHPIAGNVLVEMGVPRERTEKVLDLILEGAASLGLISEIKGKQYINLQGATIPSNSEAEEILGNPDLPGSDSAPDYQGETPNNPAAPLATRPLAVENRKVFITHGKNKDFVEPIRKLLAFGELEAVVSVEKQSVSQPVPDKVMDDMRSCGAAIIHVDGEKTMLDKDANEEIVLNPNVLIEIGAAMALYGRKFILLVRDGVKLPSNLQGLYEVRYVGEGLDGDATIRLLEAINEMKRHESS